MPIAVTRIGDEGSGHATNFPQHPAITGSPNVFINGVAAVRVGDTFQVHSNGVTSHSGNLAQGSPNVFVNGLALGRIGDAISCGGTVLTGSPNVFAN